MQDVEVRVPVRVDGRVCCRSSKMYFDGNSFHEVQYVLGSRLSEVQWLDLACFVLFCFLSFFLYLFFQNASHYVPGEKH